MLRAGLPRPDTQARIQTRTGAFWADLGWLEQRVLGEYDGFAKYSAAGAATESVVAEKRRQDAIEEEDYSVVRIDDGDLRAPADLSARVRRRGNFGPRIPRPELYG